MERGERMEKTKSGSTIKEQVCQEGTFMKEYVMTRDKKLKYGSALQAAKFCSEI